METILGLHTWRTNSKGRLSIAMFETGTVCLTE